MMQPCTSSCTDRDVIEHADNEKSPATYAVSKSGKFPTMRSHVGCNILTCARDFVFAGGACWVGLRRSRARRWLAFMWSPPPRCWTICEGKPCPVVRNCLVSWSFAWKVCIFGCCMISTTTVGCCIILCREVHISLAFFVRYACCLQRCAQ